MCVCVRERESVCVCVKERECVCETERDRVHVSMYECVNLPMHRYMILG